MDEQRLSGDRRYSGDRLAVSDFATEAYSRCPECASELVTFDQRRS
jgi:hypothetical protein